LTFDPVRSLERDWRRLSCTVLPARLRVWGQTEPALSGFGDARRLIAFLRGAASSAAKDEVLRSLVRIARDDPIAARVVLEALVPGLARLAERIIFDERDRDELWALILGHAWRQIRTHPLARRPRKIAANLILETRRAALADFTRERRRRSELIPRPLSVIATAPSGPDVETLLRRAVAAGAISRAESELVLRTRIDGVPLQRIAAEEGVGHHTLNVRRLRAEKRLLLFLGCSPVTFRAQKAHWSGARAVGTTRRGRIAATPRRRG